MSSPGASVPAEGAPATLVVPALYHATVSHTRREQLVRTFRHGTYVWLVDVDRLPALRWPWRALARFRERDHGTEPDLSIRGDLQRWLGDRGVSLDRHRVLMLSSAAVFGYVFNPLTVYWCLSPDIGAECRVDHVIAEVHNTYGGSHRYLLRPGPDGRSTVAKEFYVSPFFPVDGRYTLRTPLPAERLGISVRLWRPDPGGAAERLAFSATLTGRRRAATVSELLRLFVRYPLSTLRVAGLIRWHGIRLRLRGLPVHDRPRDEES